ncbi:hypothetical protein [Sphingobacterium haloxyli]|nr:hypothetical protein [Sphingobacterium haloxyli]
MEKCEIIMLDKVQKKRALTPSEEKHLKTKKLIEGRKPNYYIGVKVAQTIGQKAAHYIGLTKKEFLCQTYI